MGDYSYFNGHPGAYPQQTPPTYPNPYLGMGGYGYTPPNAYGMMPGYAAHPGYSAPQMPPPAYPPPHHPPAPPPADLQTVAHGILKPAATAAPAAAPSATPGFCGGFCSGGTQAGTISSDAPPPPPPPRPAAPPAPCPPTLPAAVSASAPATHDSGLVVMSGTGAAPDRMRGMCSSSSAPPPVQSALQAALSAFEARLTSAADRGASFPAVSHHAIAQSAAAHAASLAPPHGAADARGAAEGGGAAEKRLALMQRFAERSSLEGPSKIGAPRVFKKEKVDHSADGMEYDDAPAAPAALPPVEALPMPTYGLAMDPAGMAVQQQLQKAIEKEIAEKARNAQGQPAEASSFSKAPPAHLWPLPLKRWVEKCFLLCRTSLERTAMQRQVQAVIERAAEAEEVNSRDWDKEPVPSRYSEKDRKRAQMFSGDEYERPRDDRDRERDRRDRDRDRDRDRREDYRRRDDHHRRDYDRRDERERDRRGYR